MSTPNRPTNEALLEERLNRLMNVCRQAGLSVTPQRIEIYKELAKTIEHPDVDTIFLGVRGKLPTVSKDTVYRTLASLEELGLINKVDPVCGRVRYDANQEEHHHFVCTVCGKIRDIYLPLKDKIELPDNLGELGQAESVHLQVRGICRSCREKTN